MKKYIVICGPELAPGNKEFREAVNMTQAERDKVDNKTSALNMFSTRACKVNYDPELKD